MIRFSKFLWLYGLISAIVIIPGIVSLLVFGLKPSIDFAGGTLLEAKFTPPISQEKIQSEAQKQAIVFSTIQKTGDEFLLRTKETDSEKLDSFLASVKSGSSVSAEIKRQEIVGPVLGQELLYKALIAALLAVIAILLYVAYAFKNVVYGISAIAALFHDLLVVIGCFSLLGLLKGVEVDTLFVTAVLTTMSFSVHDTIVVFDRMREHMKRFNRVPVEDIADRALTETMSRSLANSVTIILMLVALVLLGGESVRWFAVALLIGTVSGTYSSPFVATPVMLLITRWQQKKRT